MGKWVGEACKGVWEWFGDDEEQVGRGGAGKCTARHRLFTCQAVSHPGPTDTTVTQCQPWRPLHLTSHPTHICMWILPRFGWTCTPFTSCAMVVGYRQAYLPIPILCFSDHDPPSEQTTNSWHSVPKAVPKCGAAQRPQCPLLPHCHVNEWWCDAQLLIFCTY